MPDERSVAKRSLYIYGAALLLGVLFVQAMSSIPHLSITFDEDLHISTGYSVLRTGDLRLVEDHPPLVGLWMSWPLLLSPETPEPQEVPTWEQGDRRLFVRNEVWWRLPIDAWVIPPRIPVAWLSLLMGALLFRWASEWFGPRGGLLALVLFVFDPNILAHGTLATLDLGVTCLIFVTMYGVQRWMRRPNGTNLVLSGVFLGLALGAKISALSLLPISVGLLVLWGVRRWRLSADLILRLMIYLSVYVGVAFVTLWAVHLFQFGSLPDQGLTLSLPAPTFWRSLLRVGRHSAVGNQTYLLGETYVGGRWHYFPVTFALKTPLPTLLLLGAATTLALRAVWRNPRRLWREFVLASLPVSYFLASMVNQINLGYRHLLPILPFLYLFIARLAEPAPRHSPPPGKRRQARTGPSTWTIWKRFSRWRPVLLALLLLWQAAGTLRTWPFPITFFNEIAGGPENGYRYLADSNVDWGQALKALRDYLEARDWPDVRLSSYVFFIRPEMYGIQATPLPPLAGVPPIFDPRFNPPPGNYVISASTLRGLKLVEDEMYNWFARREPDDIVANAMLVYRVPARTPRPTWLAQCSVPVTPLSPEAAAEGFGREDLRMPAFDCTQSWLYPDAGASSGWYVLHREVLETGGDFVPFIRQRLEPARLSFEQKIPHETPALTVFEWDPPGPAFAAAQRSAWAAPVAWAPGQAEREGTPVSAPVILTWPDTPRPSSLPGDGLLVFEGYEVAQEGRKVTLLTLWRVQKAPDRPFSLMAHLVDVAGRPVAVGDGLGVPWDQLRAGDRLVQRHVLSVPPELSAGPYWLQTGAYWLDTMARFPVLSEGRPAGDKLLLVPVDVPN